MLNYIKIILIFFILFLLFSCYEQTIVLDYQNFATGKLTYNIKYNDYYKNFVEFEGKSDSFILKLSPLYDRDLFSQAFLNSTKISNISYEVKETNSETLYNISFNFNDIENVSKTIEPFFIKNSIYVENKIVTCESKVSIKLLGDEKKIRSNYKSLDPQKKKEIDAYLLLVNFKLVFIASVPIIMNTTSQKQGVFTSELLENYSITSFETEILSKLKKIDEKDYFNTFYKKDKNKNIYYLKQKIDTDNKIKMIEILNNYGYRNKAEYNITLFDLLNSDTDFDVKITFKKD